MGHFPPRARRSFPQVIVFAIFPGLVIAQMFCQLCSHHYRWMRKRATEQQLHLYGCVTLRMPEDALVCSAKDFYPAAANVCTGLCQPLQLPLKTIWHRDIAV